LRAGFREDREPAVARFANFFEGIVAGEMNDVNGAAGHFGESDGAGSSFGFGGSGAGEGVILRGTLSFGERFLNDDVDGAAVFRVHADESGLIGSLRHGAEDAGIVQHKDAGISHEEFEAGDPFADELRHFLELRRAQVGDDAVESVVSDGFALGFLHPGVEGVAQGLALVLDGEVDERGGAAEGCGGGAGLEVVGTGSAAEGHVEMSVHVDAARKDEEVGGVDDPAGVLGRELCGDGGDLLVGDADVGDVSVARGDDGAVVDDGVKR